MREIRVGAFIILQELAEIAQTHMVMRWIVQDSQQRWLQEASFDFLK
jgi:hypothetical protein